MIGRRRPTQARIAASLGVSASTVSRVLARAACLELGIGQSKDDGNHLTRRSRAAFIVHDQAETPSTINV